MKFDIQKVKEVREMTDQFLTSAGAISALLLPIIGVVALIFLCIFLSKASKLLSAVTEKVKALDGSLKLVEQSLEKVQAPLDLGVKVSHTVDEVHDKGYEAIQKAGIYISENVDTVKEQVMNLVKKKKNKVEDKFEETADMTSIIKKMREVSADERS